MPVYENDRRAGQSRTEDVASISFNSASRVETAFRINTHQSDYVSPVMAQMQERLTAQVADCLGDRLEPLGVLVVVEAEHLCMSLRGVRKPGPRR